MRKLILLLMAWLLALPLQAQAQRYALLIANGSYGPELGSLTGPSRDAALLKPALERAGFTVSVASNLNSQGLTDRIGRFATQLQQAGPQAVGFLYFAGHGAADRRRGENYLLPVDAKPRSSAELALQGVSLNNVLNSMEASGAKAPLVVIDACRNVPFANERSTARGLVRKDIQTDVLVAYATAPDTTASDDGLFAQVLAEELVRPGATSLTAFNEVKSRVARATNRMQIPRIDDGLVEHIAFSSSSLASKPVVEEKPVVVPPVARPTEPKSTNTGGSWPTGSGRSTTTRGGSIQPRNYGATSGTQLSACGCWGPTMGATVSEGRCSSGSASTRPCAGMCAPMGGSPYALVCN